MDTDQVLAGLKEIVGNNNFRIDAQSRTDYGCDWTRFLQPDPLAVVFVESSEQIVDLVKFARANAIGLVPSGGRTGLSAGSVATMGEVVVSFDKLNKILDFSEADSTVTAQAGVITAELQNFADEKGLYYPVDFASAGSSQLGGNIATNAGGIKVLRYGLTRQWVTGLKVVTGAGDVLNLNNGLIKNATGYDLRHLFIGSEGTLGFILEATMKLTNPPSNLVAILLSVPALENIIKVLLAFREHIELTAYEFFSDLALKHVTKRLAINEPFPSTSPYYVLLEFDDENPKIKERVIQIFEECLAEGWVSDGIISQNDRERNNLWRYREAISESITPCTPYKNDLSVTISNVPSFLSRIETIVKKRCPTFEIVWFGHIGDGNLHLNILKPEEWELEAFKEKCEQVSEEIAQVVYEFDGSVSAEHGVGLLKKPYIGFTRSAAELSYMGQLKQVFDPDGIMNPGKLIPESVNMPDC